MNKREKTIIISILLLAGTIAIGILFGPEGEYQRAFNKLIAVTPQQVIAIKVYPKTDRGFSKNPIIFNSPNPLINEFMDALANIRPYSPSHDRSEDRQVWLLDLLTEEDVIQILFYIPYEREKNVVGVLRKLSNSEITDYGSFQSRQLYDWYQTYSHRWLTPEDDRDSE
jgi:hypothetical protein